MINDTKNPVRSVSLVVAEAPPRGLCPAGFLVCRELSHIYLTIERSSLPARKRGTLVAGILIRAPVNGLTPSRARRVPTSKVPKPVNDTLPPRLSSPATSSVTAATAMAACFRDIPVALETASESCDLFILLTSLPYILNILSQKDFLSLACVCTIHMSSPVWIFYLLFPPGTRSATVGRKTTISIRRTTLTPGVRVTN